MQSESRRQALKFALFGGVGLTASAVVDAQPTATTANEGASAPEPRRGKGIDGQRKADLGNGQFLNPVIPGDRPDPAILKDGADYYMTFSSFESYPGMIIWHSQDLVNWVPIGPALKTSIGSVLAVSLVKHNGRYFIYMPAGGGPKNLRRGTYVIHADDMRGPWSEPVACEVWGGIDPSHVVGEDGKRYLFLNGIDRVKLTDDGLKAAGPVERVYNGWKYPEEWIDEAFSLESPKLFRRGEYFYLVCAQGGTYGPPTGHMITVARSKSIHGPWENDPGNPIIRTRHASEPWWLKGHGTPIEGPAGDWWIVYHAYENGFRTLGRQCLLEPIEWTADGWFNAKGTDLSKPLAKPRGGKDIGSGYALSDDFSADRFGMQWSFYKPGVDEAARALLGNSVLTLTGKGDSPLNCSPLTCIVSDRSYEASVELELVGAAEGGLLLFISDRLFIGMSHTGTKLKTYTAGTPWRGGQGVDSVTRRIHLKITNDRHVITFHTSLDGQAWTRGPVRFYTAGYDAATTTGGESLRVALLSAGMGAVRFRDFRYRGLT